MVDIAFTVMYVCLIKFNKTKKSNNKKLKAMKNQNYNSANLHNSLIWIKRSNYRQKDVSSASCLQHMDLNWIKVKGYQPKNNSANEAMMPMTSYQQVQMIQARHNFYSVAMATMMLSLLLLASAF